MIKYFYLILGFLLLFAYLNKKKKLIENAAFAGAGKKAEMIANAAKYAIPIPSPITVIEQVILPPEFQCKQIPKKFSQFIKSSNCIKVRKTNRIELMTELEVMGVPIPVEYIVNINYPDDYVPKYLDKVIEWFSMPPEGPNGGVGGGFLTLLYTDPPLMIQFPFVGVINFLAYGMIDSPQSFQVVVV